MGAGKTMSWGTARIAVANRTFSSGRRLAYFQFSSRDVGSPWVCSACKALCLRSRLMTSAGREPAVLACSCEMRVARGIRTAELMSISRSLAGDPVVAAPLQLEGKRAVAAASDPAAHQNVNEIGHDVLQQPLVVRHEQERALGRTQLIDSIRHDLEGIDVQTRIGFI